MGHKSVLPSSSAYTLSLGGSPWKSPWPQNQIQTQTSLPWPVSWRNMESSQYSRRWKTGARPNFLLFSRVVAINIPTQINYLSPFLRGVWGNSLLEIPIKILPLTLLKIIHVNGRVSWVKHPPGIILLAGKWKTCKTASKCPSLGMDICYAIIDTSVIISTLPISTIQISITIKDC